MEWTCLIVDLTGSSRVKAWREAPQELAFACMVKATESAQEAVQLVNQGHVLVLVVHVSGFSEDLQNLMRSFQANIGCISEFQRIVCDDPDPRLMAGAFEFGVEQFVATTDWPAEAAEVTREAVRLVGSPDTAEAKAVTLSRAIRSATRKAIEEAEEALGDLAMYDHRAAWVKAKACEARGDFTAAVEVYRNSVNLYQMFRPSWSSLGQSLLVIARADDAVAVFQKLVASNPYDAECKAFLASAYAEKGEQNMAEDHIKGATALAPDNLKVIESRAHLLLCASKINEAVQMLDQMSEVGPLLAAKINELGIRLSQAGNGKSALALYQKAHRIVRPELRYKISMNAALACRRLRAWDMALSYIERSEQEYGARFPKSEKIREAIKQSKEQEKAPTLQSPMNEAATKLNETGE